MKYDMDQLIKESFVEKKLPMEGLERRVLESMERGRNPKPIRKLQFVGAVAAMLLFAFGVGSMIHCQVDGKIGKTPFEQFATQSPMVSGQVEGNGKKTQGEQVRREGDLSPGRTMAPIISNPPIDSGRIFA